MTKNEFYALRVNNQVSIVSVLCSRCRGVRQSCVHCVGTDLEPIPWAELISLGWYYGWAEPK